MCRHLTGRICFAAALLVSTLTVLIAILNIPEFGQILHGRSQLPTNGTDLSKALGTESSLTMPSIPLHSAQLQPSRALPSWQKSLGLQRSQLVGHWVPFAVPGTSGSSANPPAARSLDDQTINWTPAFQQTQKGLQQREAAGADLLQHLCSGFGPGPDDWPISQQEPETFTTGQKFAGSAINWKGLQASGVCMLASAHPATWNYAPDQSGKFAAAKDGLLPSVRVINGISRLEGPEVSWYGFPSKWGFARAISTTNWRAFSYMAIIRKGIITPNAATISREAYISGGGCYDMAHTVCSQNQRTEGAVQLKKRAGAQVSSGCPNGKHMNFSWPVQDIHNHAKLATAVEAAHNRTSPLIVVLAQDRWSGFYHWSLEILPRLWSALPLLNRIPSARIAMSGDALKLSFMPEAFRILGIDFSRAFIVKDPVAADYVISPPGTLCGMATSAAEVQTAGLHMVAFGLREGAAKLAAAGPASINTTAALAWESARIGGKNWSHTQAYEHILASSIAQPLFDLPPAGGYSLDTYAAAAAQQLSFFSDGGKDAAAAYTERAREVLQGRERAFPVTFPPLNKTLEAQLPPTVLTSRYHFDLDPTPVLSAKQTANTKCLGDTHADAACGGQSHHMRIHPKPHMPLSLTKDVMGNVDWSGTAAIARLDMASGLRRAQGQRLVVLMQRKSRRWMRNKAEIKRWLETRLGPNVTVVTVNTNEILMQAVIFRAADAVISPHGAGFSALAFCRPGIAVIEMLPKAGAPPPTSMGVALMMRHKYVPVEADNRHERMLMSWKTLSKALCRAELLTENCPSPPDPKAAAKSSKGKEKK